MIVPMTSSVYAQQPIGVVFRITIGTANISTFPQRYAHAVSND